MRAFRTKSVKFSGESQSKSSCMSDSKMENSSPNTNDLYIHHMDKSTGTPPSLEEKKALSNCGNKDGNIIHVLNCISTSVATVLKCMK